MLQARYWIHRFVHFLSRHLIDFECHGTENIPQQGPLIVYFNHVNFLDPALAVALLQREVIPLSKEENLEHPILLRGVVFSV